MKLNFYGNNSEILNQKADDYIALAEKFQLIYHHSEMEIFSSPGRTEIGGNHTDHQFGRVLAGAVNMDNIAVAAKNNSATICITSAIIMIIPNGIHRFFLCKLLKTINHPISHIMIPQH